MFYRFAKTVVHFILIIIGGRFQVQNKEKIIEAPYVVVSTHTSWIEIIYLAFAVYPTSVHYMAKQELFKGKFLNWLMTHLNAFPVNRENPGPSAIKAPIRLLKQGKVVGIFPSGTRKQTNLHLKRGAVTIAYKGKVPMLPAVYDGPKTFGELIKRKPIIIRFGDAVQVHDSDLEQKEVLEQKSNELMETFEKLQAEIDAAKKRKEKIR
ncbi:1-acyl-sn-glycerol-3-phosphate acyltransferase [Listeria floridensis FSL S10-1187]|uniref:1-acyl-sn-glycerol-3-phosphate acyltransferase n=1 Tax=Listeria floridensis FSL S10-1187 TaxID=1265817 RepID=A0ABN0RG60_9LIST|nr:1-acyl-sn-glycerol-3-phosphate acyltransferase [Listeria floridensis]EUJ32830.1 1-acyl-sn-glycerol-3-phosphate acyltransferase [Listeria floridensis FSL S10-1187]